MADRGMLQAAEALRRAGFAVARFNFSYREKGARFPDPMPQLKARISEVCARVRQDLKPRRLVIGGRSMGGRAASMLAAEDFECDALLLLAYPLHPAGNPEKLRAAHLSQIRVPVLCFNGTRDELCRRDLMEQALAKLRWQMHWLEGATHTFRPRDLKEVEEVSRAWLSRLG